MSELTPCNYCSLQHIRSRAEQDGATVTLAVTPDMPEWVAVSRSDRSEPVAYMMALSTQCVC